MRFAVKTRDCPPRQDRFPFLNNELLLDEAGWGPQMIRSTGAERGPQPRVFPCTAGAPPRPANCFAGWGPAPSPTALTSCPHLAKPPPLPAPRVRQNEEAATVTQRSGMSTGEQTAEAPRREPPEKSVFEPTSARFPSGPRQTQCVVARPAPCAALHMSLPWSRTPPPWSFRTLHWRLP